MRGPVVIADLSAGDPDNRQHCLLELAAGRCPDPGRLLRPGQQVPEPPQEVHEAGDVLDPHQHRRGDCRPGSPLIHPPRYIEQAALDVHD